MNATTTTCLPFLFGIAALAAQDPPNVVALDPPHLAIRVDAGATTRLTVVFDRDMDSSIYGVCGSGPSFPKVQRTAWKDARTFVLDVELQPERVYSMDLACPGSSGFRATDGQPLAHTPWRIATKGQPLADGVAAQAADRLFTAIREHYSYRDRLGIDWADHERQSQADLHTAPDFAALALRITHLLGAAQDPHISVRWMEATLPTYQRSVVSNFDPRGLQKVLPKLERIGRIGLMGRTDDGIGYLLVASFAREQREDFDKVLQALRTLRDTKALVLDVRTNGGGDELQARRLAGFFVRGEKIYAAHRLRDPKAAEGYSDRQDRSIRENSEPDLYDKPVAVLMGPLNMSSAEAFLLMMKQAPKAVLVGTTSYGSSGNPVAHTLSPGLTVMLPSWQALRPDGTCFEGEGITPHIPIEVRPDELRDGDPVLAEALQRLRGSR